MKKGKKGIQLSIPASLWKRAIAYGIDLAIEVLLLGGFLFLAGILYLQDSQSSLGSFQMLCFLISCGILFLYLPHRWHGQTLGKHLVGIKVMRINHQQCTLLQQGCRECLLKLVLAVVLIPCTLLFLVYARCCSSSANSDFLLHDRVLGTMVISV